MVLAWVVAAVLVISSVMLHYEALRGLDWAVMHLKKVNRLRVVFVVLGCFCAHIAEVIMFAVGLYLSATRFGLGALKGATGDGFGDYLYLSLTCYTSLGLGDIYPTGPLRLLIGVEALVGLTLIAWSATFTFLEMQSIWKDGRALAISPPGR